MSDTFFVAWLQRGKKGNAAVQARGRWPSALQGVLSSSHNASSSLFRFRFMDVFLSCETNGHAAGHSSSPTSRREGRASFEHFSCSHEEGVTEGSEEKEGRGEGTTWDNPGTVTGATTASFVSDEEEEEKNVPTDDDDDDAEERSDREEEDERVVFVGMLHGGAPWMVSSSSSETRHSCERDENIDDVERGFASPSLPPSFPLCVSDSENRRLPLHHGTSSSFSL